VALKGAHTVIAAPGQPGVVLPFANPALASGDVLASYMMVQGLALLDTAVCDADVHGQPASDSAPDTATLDYRLTS